MSEAKPVTIAADKRISAKTGEDHKRSRHGNDCGVSVRHPAGYKGKEVQHAAAEAKAAGMDGLKGHRSVGGIRASIYNAFPPAGCDALASFMSDFASKNG